MVYFVVPLIALVLLVVSYTMSRQIWDILDTPTVSPSGAIVGTCEIFGKASTELNEKRELKAMSLSPLAGVECVWYHILVEEYKQNGDDKEWVTIHSKESNNGFRVVDGYGGVFVDPSNAQKYLSLSVDKSEAREYVEKAQAFFNSNIKTPAQEEAKKWQTSPDGYYMYHPNLGKYIPSTYVNEDRTLYYDEARKNWFSIYVPSKTEAILGSIKNAFQNFSDRDIRVTETVVYPMQEIFVHGYVSFPADNSAGNELVIGASGKRKSNYFISNSGEKTPLKNLKVGRFFALAVGFILSVIAVMMYREKYIDFTQDQDSFVRDKFYDNFVPLLIVVFIFIFALVLLKLGRTYNRFVKLKQQIVLSGSTIDIVLKRRKTLIPQLQTVVEEASKHEQALQESVAKLRGAKDDDFYRSIYALGEAYPNLKVSSNFLQLQNELGRSEEKIAMARSFMNDSILNYNNLRATITGILFTSFFKKYE